MSTETGVLSKPKKTGFTNNLSPDGNRTEMENLESRIRNILSDKNLGGSYPYERVASIGQRFVHSCSYAIGMSLVSARQAFQSKFGSGLPEWFEVLAPNKAARIYRRAVAEGTSLAQAPHQDQIVLRR